MTLDEDATNNCPPLPRVDGGKRYFRQDENVPWLTHLFYVCDDGYIREATSGDDDREMTCFQHVHFGSQPKCRGTWSRIDFLMND